MPGRYIHMNAARPSLAAPPADTGTTSVFVRTGSRTVFIGERLCTSALVAGARRCEAGPPQTLGQTPGLRGMRVRP